MVVYLWEKSVLSAQMAKCGVYCAKYKALCEWALDI